MCVGKSAIIIWCDTWTDANPTNRIAYCSGLATVGIPADKNSPKMEVYSQYLTFLDIENRIICSVNTYLIPI